MITEWQIQKMINEHIQTMDSSFGIDEIIVRINFMAGVIAVLKLQNRNEIRFMSTEKHE